MPDAAPPPYYDPPQAPFATQKSDLRAGVGQRVGKRLDAAPQVWRLCSDGARPVQLYLRDQFLTPAECQALCAQIDAGSYPSPLYEKEKHAEVRTSYSCNFDVHDPLVSAVETRIAAFLGMDRSWGEPLQGQRYRQGQQFREHADFFYIDQPYWAEYEPHGGQRTWTAMIYLNVPQRGGATGFKLLGIDVSPSLGRLLIWNNMAADGSPNPWTLHEGRPVKAGVKYIVTKWYRERPFS
ncbi:2OG-Fe(II) oxygenase [Sphingomonas sp.]|uniref:2OG-Fe(II) oxygenase n=1 Tax=Sphingomonas sp. TaxID=28214 RepID=UPI0025FF906A|nr:2OG-Fe(II) oxygenase [Sphingomonas sp.]MBV9528369.1 2OG-Fe(II) oxygenase [Sphingomonas sp.]